MPVVIVECRQCHARRSTHNDPRGTPPGSTMIECTAHCGETHALWAFVADTEPGPRTHSSGAASAESAGTVAAVAEAFDPSEPGVVVALQCDDAPVMCPAPDTPMSAPPEDPPVPILVASASAGRNPLCDPSSSDDDAGPSDGPAKSRQAFAEEEPAPSKKKKKDSCIVM